mmetsp:Transcript_26723/g.39692  ORF Transcript_26723/g.39692 Transcript_26723/m.39692 type:complete len:147 (+) Transcript_26723:212-652(+)
MNWGYILMIVMWGVQGEELIGGWCGNSVHECKLLDKGEWTRCDMCMCEKLDKFVRDAPRCSANNELYACFISYENFGDNSAVGCKTEMKRAWVIGLTVGFSFLCASICCILAYFIMKWKEGSKAAEVAPDFHRLDTEIETQNTETK